MINIAEILKDCPKGTKLYSPICGNCKLLKIYNGLGLDVINDADEVFNFSYDGRYNLNGECCIFPSKDKRDWNTFRPFKDGDIIAKDEFIVIFSHSKQSEVKVKEQIVYYHCYLRGSSYFKPTKDCGVGYISDFRFATDEEKQKLFDVIKAFGYKWNSETKTLEKLIVPKFKDGDKIKEKNERFPSTRTIDNYVEGIGYYTTIHDWVRIEDQDNWELLVITPKFKVGDEIVKKNGTTNSYIVNSVYSDYYGLTLPNSTGIAVLNIYEQDEWELVSIMPKFKVGDRIKLNNSRFIYTITDLLKDRYRATTDSCDLYEIEFERQDAYKLVPTHKFKVGDKIVKKDSPAECWYVQGVDTNCNLDYFYYIVAKGKIANLHFKEQDEWELVPNKFDISTLKAYDKVLVRDTNEQVWVADLFSHVLDRPLGGYTFACVGHYPNQCIPYLDNEHLLGTNNDCDEYYKNW